MPRNDGSGHWHITRDIKPKGECRGCDKDYWNRVEPPPRVPDQGDKPVLLQEPARRRNPAGPNTEWLDRPTFIVETGEEFHA